MDQNEHVTPKPALTPQAEETAADAAPEPSLGDWLKSNGPTLAILGALFFYLYIKFDTDGLWAIAKAALGLGFVIFVHELGHFLVAKWCDVHVTTFSIGFGPAIPGCVFKWGETTYKLALFPLGGYVQMVGQVDGDESTDEGAVEDPRSYRNKAVWQRMAIISAGVIMNVILAIICFIVVFQGPGKDRKAAIVDTLDSDGPAARAGFPTGDVIYKIGDVDNPYFEDLMVWVMGSSKGEKLPLVLGLPDGPREMFDVEPRKEATDSRPLIGISPPDALQFESKRYSSKMLKTPARPASAAASASPPFAFEDRIVAMTDPDKGVITDLPFDKRKPGSQQRDYFEFYKRLRRLAGQPVVIRVEREEDGKTKTVDVTVPPAFRPTFGVRMAMGQITMLRKGGPAAKAGVEARERDKSDDGDVIVRVEVREPNGALTRFSQPLDPVRVRWDAAVVVSPLAAALRQLAVKDVDLDPLRLPYELRQWARRMKEANKANQRTVVLHVLRHGENPGGPRIEAKTRELSLKWDEKYEDNKEIPMGLNSPLSIPGLGLGYRVKTTVDSVDPKVKGVAAVTQPGAAAGAADAVGDPALADTSPNPLRPGDIIKDVKWFAAAGPKEEPTWEPWLAAERLGKDLGPEQWAHVAWILQSSPTIKQIALKVERRDNKDTKVEEITLRLREAKDWPLEQRGFLLVPDLRRQKADSIGGAIALGLKDTKNSILQVYQNLRGMITRRISVENLGGPVTIARVAYHFAGIDFWEFVFFLGLISVNLAVINFLPIPVLDGGHMVFLFYEAIRGKPASEGVRVGATYAGLLLLASLMIFVLFLDIKRLL